MVSDGNLNGQDRPVISPPRPQRGRMLLRLLFTMVLIVGTAAITLIYSDELKRSWFAQLLGVQCDLSTGNMDAAQERIKQADAESAKGDRKALYWVDPMNPTMRSDKPGKAPCGMDLIPVYAEDEPPKDQPTASRKILYWVDPMDANMRSDKPGKSPMGMEMVPVYADEGPTEEKLPPGTVKISAQRQQQIGVEYGEVQQKALSKTIRTVARLTYDETKIAHIHTRISGWIEKVYVDFVGKLVKKGQPLLTIYSPELVSTQRELLIARKSRDILGDSPFLKEAGSNAFSLYDSTRERLKLWDIPESEIRAIEKRGTPTKALTLYSPLDGFVLTRNGFTGLRVSPEMDLYVLADLSTIWALADVYEYELPMITLGQKATMTLAYFPGKAYSGKVTFIYPSLEQQTRTLKVRLEFDNPSFELKPDMFANVEIKIDYGTHLAVPRDAVLDSGSEQVVFIAREGGYFEPRKVSLGQQVGNEYIVLDGLKSGERVVTSANFLVDSESQLKSVLGGMAAGAHAAHGGAAPAGSDEKSKTPAQSPKSPPAVGEADHSQHEPKQPAAKTPEKPAIPQASNGGTPPSEHAGHGN